MKIRELFENILKNQEEMKSKIDVIDKILKRKFRGEFEIDEMGYMTVNDMKRLGASTKFGKDGKEYIWADKTDVSEVLQNAKELGLLREAKENMEYFIDISMKNAEKYMQEQYKGRVIDILKRKMEECKAFK